MKYIHLCVDLWFLPTYRSVLIPCLIIDAFGIFFWDSYSLAEHTWLIILNLILFAVTFVTVRKLMNGTLKREPKS